MAQKKRKPKQHRKLPPGMTYAEALAQQQRQLEAVREAAEGDSYTRGFQDGKELTVWVATVSLADAYGFGPRRVDRFLEAFTDNMTEYVRMQEEGGEVYALEKLRQKAERVLRKEITYDEDN